ncbi:type I polyketide synthase [Nostoc sp. DedSLP04]|uniref:type I polyketide synthase n=1 Tax=Nostoc sp. DedSLP04 TaxID=3075401 RepID=UPI002AD31A99|nr:type I polyketide synthase [Nostoc sp. DedSLP04]MDZ8033646.1 type I polyketide synthase [Nostoc sp. DedSLP04]
MAANEKEEGKEEQSPTTGEVSTKGEKEQASSHSAEVRFVPEGGETPFFPLPPASTTLSPTKRALLALEQLQTKLDALEYAKAEPIAIIGMGCRFPGGVKDPESFWQMLHNGTDAITKVPRSRWGIDDYYDPNPQTPGKISVADGGFLDDEIGSFDPQFFGLSPREATYLDPQQRLLLEVSWEALEQAHIVPQKLFNSLTGVFVGIGANDYARHLEQAGVSDAYIGTGNALSVAAGRISYVLGLTGPSLAVDTSCSSSLVAVHLACQSLRLQECDLALAGGVNLMLSPATSIIFSQAGMLASDGRCKTFDAQANGYVRSEGCGIIALKRLSDAQRDGDRILALIRGSAINQDGPSGGLTVPNGPSQEAVIRQALKNGGVEPAQVSYIEAHGTGTSLGDPIELGALGAVFGSSHSQSRPLNLGSVKTNIGHAEFAAGIAGLIKIVLQLQHQAIAPHLHFHQPNPHINWADLPVVIPTQTKDWLRGNTPRIAGVSSFGFSGTNAHVVLEEAPIGIQNLSCASSAPEVRLKIQNENLPERPLHLLGLSAKSKTALLQLALAYRAYLETAPELELADVCFSANTGRSHFKHRLAVVTSSSNELRQKLGQLIALEQVSGVYSGQSSTISPKVAFLFTGQGSQYIGIGQQLYQTQPTFRQVLDRCATILHSLGDKNLLEILYPFTGTQETTDTEVAIFAFEFALAQMWQSWGVKPSILMGDGVGEYVAACLAGVFSLEDGLRLIVARSQLSEEFAAIAKAIAYHLPKLPIVSNVTGQIGNADIACGQYWVNDLRQPETTVQSIQTLHTEGYKVFLEIGTQPMLSEMRVSLPESEVLWLASLQPGQDEWQQLLANLAQLYVRGVAIDWFGFEQDYARHKVTLPTYPFQRQRYWVERQGDTADSPIAASTSITGHPLLGRQVYLASSQEIRFESEISSDRPAYIQYHRVYDQVILPAASFFEMALFAGIAVFGTSALVLEDVLVQQPLILPAGENKALQLVVTLETTTAASFKIFSLTKVGEAAKPVETLHVSGKVAVDTQPQSPLQVDIAAIQERLSTELLAEDFYQLLESLGIDIDPPLRALQQIHYGDSNALYSYQLPQEWMGESIPYTVHPILLDGCVQVGGFSAALFQEVERETYLPFGVDRFRFYRSPSDRCLCYSQKLISENSDRTNVTLKANLVLLDSDGTVFATLEGLRSRRATTLAVGESDRQTLADWLYEVEWRLQARFGQPLAPEFLATPGEIAEKLTPDLLNLIAQVNLEPYGQFLQQLESLSVRYIWQALQTLGWQFQPGDVISEAALIQHLGIIPQQQLLFHRLLQILAEENILQDSGDRWQVRQCPVWETPQEISYADGEVELTLLTRCGEQLSAVLRGACDPLQLIFPNGDLASATHLYQDAPGATVANTLVEKAIAHALAALPSDRGVRLLEIGAGTGGTTSYLLPQLHPQQTEYVFTDLGSIFLSQAKEKFRDYPFVRYQTLDIERDPASQGFALHQFDIVIAVNVLHATTNLSQTLQHVRQLLATGGLLLLLEGTERQRWLDLTFGLLEGWWKFQDRDIRPDYPLVSQTQWGQLLRENGFEQVVTFPGDSSPENALSQQSLIVGRSSAVAVAQSTPKSWIVLGNRNGIGQQIVQRCRDAGDICQLVVPKSGFQPCQPDDVALDPTDPTAFVELIAQVAAQAPLQGVIQCWSLENGETLAAASQIGCGTTLHLVQGLLKAGLSTLPRLWIVTEGTQPVPGNAPLMSSIAQSAVWGLGKVITLEHPELECTCIDLDPNADVEVQTAALWAEICDRTAEDRVAFREGKRYVARLARSQFAPNEQETLLSFSAEGTYLITGGLGGLGLLVARWMVERGAKHLVLASRSSPEAEAQDRVAALVDAGATVTIASADVTNFEDISNVIADIDRSLFPLKGIIHAVGVLDDGVLLQQNWQRFIPVMAPKVQGAWNLHQLTQAHALDFFVLFSSIAALFGSPGQGNHAAANAFLDALVHYRRTLGLTGLSINWGAVSQIGAAAKQQADIRGQNLGLGAIAPEQVLKILEHLMSTAAVNVGVAPLQWSKELRRWLSRPFYQDWQGAAELSTRPVEGGFLQKLAAVANSQRRELLVNHVQTQVAQVLGLESGQAIALEQGFFELGMDSLTSVELRNRLQASLGVSIPSTAAFDYPTVGELVDYLAALVINDREQGIGNREQGIRNRKQRNSTHPVLPVPEERRAIPQQVPSTPTILVTTKNEPIAIIGMGCRFPGGADSPDAFWELLCQEVDAITEVPSDRWHLDEYYDPNPDTPGKMYARYGGFVGNLKEFDPHFFGISPREAIALDPQQRLLLEVSWEALENATLNPQQLAKTKTGVFLGICNDDYTRRLGKLDLAEMDAYISTGNAHSIASGRLAYSLGLTGPCLSVDTACSSSLVTVHLACKSLRDRESDLAIAGGVNRIFSPEVSISFSKARMLSVDGRCKTFDAAANGFVRSEGCGMVILKRLSDAVADGDRILAVIRGSAINQDGRTSGLTVPSGPSQQGVIRQALENAQLTPTDISYIEAHGTGTTLGDPIEIGALGAVFAASHAQTQPLVVGSVKTNLGHLEAAAGIAGLIKVVLQLQHQQIAPHLHLRQLNPYIDWESLPIKIPTQLMPWQPPTDSRIAGVSSFGFSGTNAHIILAEAPVVVPTDAIGERPMHLFTLSAQSERALQDLSQQYQNYLLRHPQLALSDICFSVNTGRGQFDHRVAIAVTSSSELVEKLAAGQGFSAEGVAGIFRGYLPNQRRTPKIAFLFTGQGSQYVDMGKTLYQTEPKFHQALQECEAILRTELEIPLLEILYPTTEKEQAAALLQQTTYTQPALFALEYALAQLWQSWGIQPDVVLGHSVGEYVAACIAGVFNLEEGLKLIAARGRLMQAVPGGKMVAVLASESQIRPFLDPYSDRVAIAAVNSPQNVVISGETKVIEAIAQTLEANGIVCKPLVVSHAFHSPLMAPMQAAFAQVANRVNYQPPQLTLISNVSGRVENEVLATAQHWVNHIQQPVRFLESLQTLIQQGVTHCLEIGPSPILIGMGRQSLPESAIAWLPSLRFSQPDLPQMLQSLGQLYTQGVKVDWQEFERPYRRNKVVLPTYPFQREPYWVDESKVSTALQKKTPEFKPSQPPLHHPLLGQRLRLASSTQIVCFESQLSAKNPSYLHHHRVFGRIVLPGVAYAEIIFAAGVNVLKCDRLIIEAVTIHQALILQEDEVRTVQTIFKAETANVYRFEILSTRLDTAESDDLQTEIVWHLHASGKLSKPEQAKPPEVIDIALLQQQYTNPGNSIESNYQRLDAIGFNYGSDFHAVQAFWLDADQNASLCSLQLPPQLADEANQYIIHPVLMDASAHTINAVLSYNIGEDDIYLPIGFKRAELYRRPANPQRLWSYTQLDKVAGMNQQVITQNGYSLDEDGTVIVQVEGSSGKRTNRRTLLRILQEQGKTEIQDWLYQLEWQPWRDLLIKGNREQGTLRQAQCIAGNREDVERATLFPQPQVGHWLILADATGLGQQLASELQQQGHTCTIVFAGDSYQHLGTNIYAVNPSVLEDFQRLHQEAIAPNHPEYIVHLWSLDSLGLDALAQTATQGCISLLLLVRSLLQPTHSTLPRLWIATRGTQAVTEIALPQLPLWGFARVVGLEHPQLWGGLIDLDTHVPTPELEAQQLLSQLVDSQGEDHLALRGGQVWRSRLVKQPMTRTQRLSFQAENSYLISGGLGALGLSVAEWMAESGAKHLVLTGRHAPSAQAQEAIARLQQAGLEVRIATVDVADAPSMRKLITEIQTSPHPLRGVVHAAGIIDIQPIELMQPSQLEAVFHPKVMGGWVLHELTKEIPLEFFVSFSSIAAVWGSKGQAHYAAANHFLDGLAHYRHSQGLPALSINWGPWSRYGMAASEEGQAWLAQNGVRALSPEMAIAALDYLMGTTNVQTVVADMEWQRFKQLYEAKGRGLLFKDIETQAQPQPQTSERRTEIWQRLSQVELTSDRQEILTAYFQQELAQVLQLNLSTQITTVNIQQPLDTMGLDSLMMLELRNQVQRDLEVDIPMVKLMEGITLSELSILVNEQLSENFQNSTNTTNEETIHFKEKDDNWIELEI